LIVALLESVSPLICEVAMVVVAMEKSMNW